MYRVIWTLSRALKHHHMVFRPFRGSDWLCCWLPLVLFCPQVEPARPPMSVHVGRHCWPLPYMHATSCQMKISWTLPSTQNCIIWLDSPSCMRIISNFPLQHVPGLYTNIQIV